jgi:general secretion pathway protein J
VLISVNPIRCLLSNGVNLWLNSYNSRRGGFTLIEVLLSLVLLTIILGAVYSSFFTVQRALERFDGVSLKYHEVRTLLDLMRREIEGALLKNPLLLNPDNNQTVFVIEDRDIFGKPTSRLHLTAFSFKGSGLNEISYYVQEKDENLVLLKTESPQFTLSADNPQKETLPSRGYTLEMIEGIEGFTVETLFNNKWIKTWDTKETGTLPEAVRFSIEFDDKGKKVKLTEYARPKIGKQL